MKRFFILSMLFLLLFSGCSSRGDRIKEPVKFYYLRTDYQYGQADGVIAWEEREASGHLDNLSYLIALYRMGPSDEELSLPFPEGTAILMMEYSEDEIKLALGNNGVDLSPSDLSLACACLTLTCTELTAVERVTVVNGLNEVTMTRDSISLMDSSIVQTTEETK